MKVYDKDDDMEECTSPYGNRSLFITKEQIQALLDGKVLADDEFDEYGIFIELEDAEK
jgi:hypothetical protein